MWYITTILSIGRVWLLIYKPCYVVLLFWDRRWCLPSPPPYIWSVFRNMFYLDDSSSLSQGVSIGRFPLARMLLVHKRITETEPIRRKRISIVVERIGSAMKLMWHPAIREGSRCGEVRLLIASFNMRPWLSWASWRPRGTPTLRTCFHGWHRLPLNRPPLTIISVLKKKN